MKLQDYVFSNTILDILKSLQQNCCGHKKNYFRAHCKVRLEFYVCEFIFSTSLYGGGESYAGGRSVEFVMKHMSYDGGGPYVLLKRSSTTDKKIKDKNWVNFTSK